MHDFYVFPPQEGLLEVLYDIFQLVIPVATADFSEALISVGGYSDITLINFFLLDSSKAISEAQLKLFSV